MTPNDPVVSSIVNDPVGQPRGGLSPCTEEEGRWRQLAAAILRQALLDARSIVLDIRVKSPVSRAELEAVIAEAREWLTRDYECLRFICRMAGIDCAAMLERARREFGEPNDCRPYADEITGRKIGDARPAKVGEVCDCGLRNYVLDRHGRVVLFGARKAGRPAGVGNKTKGSRERIARDSRDVTSIS